ncbi:MAG: hypothetical protein ACI3ZK_02080 [Candidatus Cryptobacteroides sp.]
MALYTINIDERTKAGKSLVNYLRNLGVIEEANETTLDAIAEIRRGEGTRCDTFDDYLKTVASL